MDVCMYGRFARAERFGAGTYRAARFHDIFPTFYGSSLNFFPHKTAPFRQKLLYPMSNKGEISQIDQSRNFRPLRGFFGNPQNRVFGIHLSGPQQ